MSTDADDLDHLSPAERTLLTTGYPTTLRANSPPEALSDLRSTAGGCTAPRDW
ncbi:MAG: hypothetical protein ACRDTC_12245 [Pseudonocardiaceae bacterium]